LNVAISINLKLKEKMNCPLILDTLINDNLSLDIESREPYNEREEVCEIIDSFLSFLTKYDERRTHSMLSLMLDPRFKSLRFKF
jgi:hypothetical protein